MTIVVVIFTRSVCRLETQSTTYATGKKSR